MYKLIKLELKKNNIRPYLHAMGIITLCVLGFLYTFAMIAYTGGDTDSAEFSNYHNIWVITTFYKCQLMPFYQLYCFPHLL